MTADCTYKIGEVGQRNWGYYKVIRAGDDFCAKEIYINPKSILSLQTHEGRSETWTVRQGALTAIINGEMHKKQAGETLFVPVKACHTIANCGDDILIIDELQQGHCDESDNTRYLDFYNRTVVESDDPVIIKSMRLYEEIAAKLRES